MSRETEDDTDAAEADPTPYALSPREIEAILLCVDAGDHDALAERMDALHPADIADLLEQINTQERARLIRLWGPKLDGDVLSELEEGLRADVIDLLTPGALADAVRDLDSDDVVDLVEDLDDTQQAAVLNALDTRERRAVERALSYPEGSAGRLMQREVVVAPEHWTVGRAIDHMRASDHLPEQFYHVTLVDPRMHPVANVTLGKLMRAPRDTPLRDLAEPTFQVIPATQAARDVAYAFNQYHLIAAPVVDEDGRIAGMITIDDAMMVLEEESEEDILRLAGVGEESSLSDTVAETVRQRLPWLAANLATAILASLVISIFEDTITAVVALAVLMPIVASMGGNAGTQSLTVAVRALATRDLTTANVWRVIRRETIVGLWNGLVFAVVMGLIGFLWFSSPAIGAVIAAAMIINLMVAGLAGTLVPIAMERLGVDPALASGTFVTTVTDVVGFFAFLGLAALVLL